VTVEMQIVPLKPEPLAIYDDADFGLQLSRQYQNAVSGMREVLVFGAMLKLVETQIVVLTRENNLPSRGPTTKGGGLQAWIADNAPSVNYKTAMRFLAVTEAVAASYEQIVGAAIAAAYELPSLVLSVNLPDEAREKQAELFDYVTGTSQRSWLDNVRPKAADVKPKAVVEEAPEKTREEVEEIVRGSLRKDAVATMTAIDHFVRKEWFQMFNDAEVDTAIEYAEGLVATLKKWRDTPKGLRKFAVLERTLKEWETFLEPSPGMTLK